MNDDHLSVALERIADQAPHEPDLAGIVRTRARRRTRRRLTIAAAGVAVIAIAGVGVARALPGDDDGAVTVATPPTPAKPCHSEVTRAVLPEWARTGFSDPKPVMPFVTSASGNLVGIMFGDQLSSPPRQNESNKVLWVWKVMPNPMDIKATARLDGTGPATTQGLPTPLAGPSYVDLPAVGCWRLDLTWPGGSDSVDLQAKAP